VTSHAAQSVKVYKNHAFIAYETSTNGLQVFDLTQLRDVKSAPVVFKETAHYDNFERAHTLIMNEETGFLYAAATLAGRETCGGGLHMIDVRTPTKPTFAGCHHNPSVGRGFVHDAQCVIYRGPDAQYKNREICVNSCESAVEIVDVTDKQHPKTISTFAYPNASYTHQGWFVDGQKYFFLDDEGDEEAVGHTRTIGFDLTNLGDPVVLTEFLHTTTDTDHNLYIRGRYIYEGNYGAGLRILDIADPKQPKEAGYLSNAGSAWTTYPYFKDDVVALSTDSGLFLARLLTR
jgi:choice-of-anchor B domain-containing protein